MKDQLNIEELLRAKLEGTEVQPSPRVWKGVSRTVRWKQFWRFMPERVNVFYVAGLIVSGTVLTVLLNDKEVDLLDGGQSPVDSVHVAADSLKEAIVPDILDPASEAASSDQKSTTTQQESNIENTTTESLTETEQTLETTVKEQAPAAEIEPVNSLVAYFIPSVTEGCAPLTVELINLSVNSIAHEWKAAGQSLVSSGPSASVTFDEPGTYTVSLVARDADGLARTHAEQIVVHPKPAAQFEIDKDEVYNYSVGAVEYSWQLLSGRKRIISEDFQFDLDHVPAAGDSLMLIATNIFGCIDTVVQRLPLPGAPELRFPTVFSPNPDGATGGYYNPNEPNNQVFYPRYSETPGSYNLKIYNKTGELIFETNEIEKGWDGYYQETPVPSGVYIYHCTGTWKNGTPFSYRGDVTILRQNP
jgi:gliding motility-associated-like protein